MLKLNKTTEYGLMALRHMSRKRLGDSSSVTSAREIADQYHLPFEITAKTLLRLKNFGLIQAEQGARGGYSIIRSLEDITLFEFLEMMEGPQTIVSCAPLEKKYLENKSTTSDEVCGYFCGCEIKGLMSNLNARVQKFLSSIKLAELAESPGERIQLAKPMEALASNVTQI